jgi:hypothetical protein
MQKMQPASWSADRRQEVRHRFPALLVCKRRHEIGLHTWCIWTLDRLDTGKSVPTIREGESFTLCRGLEEGKIEKSA